MDKPLRIAMLSLHSSPVGQLGTQDTGGMSVCIREVCRQLGRAGHRVDIYTRAEPGKCNREIRLYENVRLVHLSIEKNGHVPKNMLYPFLPDFSDALEGYRTRSRLQYDLIHSHYWLSGWVGTWAQDRWNLPHVLTFHTTGMAKRVYCFQEREPQLRLASEKKLARKCDRILVPTEREKEFLVRYYNAPREKIGLVPCGVNLNRFRPMKKSLARKQLGFHGQEAIILFVGRFTPLKGLERLLAAVGHLRHLKGLRLVIVGGDGQESKVSTGLRRMASSLGVHYAVQFAGRVEHEDLSAYYSAADVLAVPSYYESFGLVMLESLACGTPVVASRVGATDRIIQNNKTGLVLEDPSPRSLASAIEECISRSSNNILSRPAIRESVLEHSWSNIAAAMVSEYYNLIRERALPNPDKPDKFKAESSRLKAKIIF